MMQVLDVVHCGSVKGTASSATGLVLPDYGADQRESWLPVTPVLLHQGLKWHLGNNKDHSRLDDMIV